MIHENAKFRLHYCWTYGLTESSMATATANNIVPYLNEYVLTITLLYSWKLLLQTNFGAFVPMFIVSLTVIILIFIWTLIYYDFKSSYFLSVAISVFGIYQIHNNFLIIKTLTLFKTFKTWYVLSFIK